MQLLPNPALPLLAFGPLSPVRVHVEAYDGAPFPCTHFGTMWPVVEAFFQAGTPIDLEYHRNELEQLERYLDVPLLRLVLDGQWQEIQHADCFLWWWKKQSVTTRFTAKDLCAHGQLETLRWYAAQGQTIDFNALIIIAARYGHLETLQWIRAHGGEWSHMAANWAAMNGHLETLQWIRAHGGEWTHWAADWAAMNGHLETLQWIRAN